MKKNIAAVVFLFFAIGSKAQSDSAMFRKIFDEALTNGKSYNNLYMLTTKVGGRLSGSPQAKAAVQWAFEAMKNAGADTVYLQECMVPHWVRGEKETAKVIASDVHNNHDLNICALGGSIATPKDGLKAGLVEVHGLEGLKTLKKEQVQGKIVFFNEPMNPTYIETFRAYGKAVEQRWGGAMAAAKMGAIGVVVRSCTLSLDDYPHTGAMGYNDSVTKIPACAISTLGANWLSEMIKKDKNLAFYFKMSCETLPDEKSYNVVGEIRGSEKKNEYITVGGHLDSWDTGKGANDDGSGVVQSIEVLRIFKALHLKPSCTIRAVAFMNEENGLRGGKKYAELAEKNKETHIAAVESDAGSFTPLGFSSNASKEVRARLVSWKPLFLPYGLYNFEGEGGGADIGPLNKNMGVPLFGLEPDSQRYFDYHHTPIDIIENVNKRELELGGASMAALIYLIQQYGLK